MSAMKRISYAFVPLLFAIAIFAARPVQAQDGSIEFTASATPSGGLEEPVRGFPFYLLRKSFAQIGREVSASSPAPAMDPFIDGLNVSPELKAWMKKHHWIKLSGPDFVRKLKADDVMGIPEFDRAYMDTTASEVSMDFPKPKYKASDEQKNPEKYKRLVAAYHDAIHHYIEENPQSLAGIETELGDADPETKWNQALEKSARQNHRLALDLAESKYLVAKTDTDLQGQGSLRGIPPGAYWISSLDLAATVGDVRPRWDVPVRVRAGQNAFVALSNVNAVQPSQGAQ